MFEYIRLNKIKISKAFFYSVIGCILIAGILLIIVPSRPEITLAYKTMVLLTGALIMACMAVGLNIFAGFYQFSEKRKVFNDSVLQVFFIKNNFKKILLNTDAKRRLVEEAMSGYVNNFPVIVNLDKITPGDIVFCFYTDLHKIPDNKLDEVLILLAKDHNACVEPGGIISIKFRIKSAYFSSNIEMHLKQFSQKLTEWQFSPGLLKNQY